MQSENPLIADFVKMIGIIGLMLWYDAGLTHAPRVARVRGVPGELPRRG